MDTPHRNMTNQQKLLASFKQRNLAEFKKIIKCEDVDIDYLYDQDPDNETLLDLAGQSSGASEYVLILLLNGASVMYWSEEKLAEAFEKNADTTTINYLRVANVMEVEQKEDEFYDTLIRKAVENNDVNIMRLIAYYSSRNTSDYRKPAILPRLLGSIEAVRVLIEYFDVDMEFQRDSRGHARTYRDIILQKYPELEPELAPTSQSELHKILYSYLFYNASDLFLNRIDDLRSDFLDKSLTHNETYLYVACKKGYIDVVDVLLEKHVELNTLATDKYLRYLKDTCTSQPTPLAVAAYMGHYEIVAKLITHNAHLQIEGVGSALSFVLRGMNHYGVSKDTHRQIIKLLLIYNSQTIPELDINHKDEYDMTPLHFAIASSNEFAIQCLVYAGADLYTKDPDGKLPLFSVPATILENYFDRCIILKKQRNFPKFDQIVTFDYSVFERVDQNLSTTAREMEFFDLIQQKPELRTLLKHTLSESFLYVKWCLIRKYYFLNFAFYSIFCGVMNAYIFQIHDCPSSSISHNSSELTDTEINHQTSSILCNASWLRLGIITFLLYIVFILREFCQVLLSKKQYFKSPENCLEIVMIFTVGVFFANQRSAHLAATVNLISCIELVFLLGKHPWFSIYVEMFKTVALNFAKFFALFSILAISFASSFYILFRNRSEENKTNVDPSNHTIENTVNLWPGLWVSIIKSIIMMTGEFEASTLPLGENFNYSHVFLFFFIFLVPMVLYNLLNGLAISDTNAIMKDSEIVAVISRVKLIWQLERLANSKWSQVIRKRYPEFLNHRFFRDVEMIILADESSRLVTRQLKTLTVQSSLNYSIQFDVFGKTIGKMPLTIIKQAEQIVENRKLSNSDDEYVAQNISARDENKTSSNSEQRFDEVIHKLSDQIRDLKLEIDLKIANIEEKMTEMNEKIADRDEKLLHSVDERNEKLLESVVQAVAHLIKQKE